MPKFDEVFADLQAKMAAAMQVIASNPELAAQVRIAIEGARTEAEIAEEAAQDEARANALNNLVLGVRQTLAEAAPDALAPPVEETPAEEPPVEEPPVEEPPAEEPRVDPGATGGEPPAEGGNTGGATGGEEPAAPGE